MSTGWNTLKAAGKYAEMLKNFDSYTDHDLDVILCASVVGASDSSGNIYVCDGNVCSHANVNRYSKYKPGHWEITSGVMTFYPQGSSTDLRGHDDELSAEAGRYTLADFRGYNHSAIAPHFISAPSELYGTANDTVSCDFDVYLGELEWLYTDDTAGTIPYRARNHYNTQGYVLLPYFHAQGSSAITVGTFTDHTTYKTATFNFPVWSTVTTYVVGVGFFKSTATTSLIADLPAIGTVNVTVSETAKALFEFDATTDFALALAESCLTTSIDKAALYYEIDGKAANTAFEGEQGSAITSFNLYLNVQWSAGGASWYRIEGTRLGMVGNVTYKNSTSVLATKTITTTWNGGTSALYYNGFTLSSDFYEGTAGKAYVFNITGLRTGASSTVVAGDAEVAALTSIDNPFNI